jgi:hypothetical protein
MGDTSFIGSLEVVERQVAAIIADLELHSYYQLLEVEPDANTAIVTYNYNLMAHAYQELLKHPQCSEGLRRNLHLLCERLEEARKVLSDRLLRRRYNEGVELGELRLEDTLHPITARTPSGVLTLEGFDLEVPQFDPKILMEEGRPPPMAPEPALETDPAVWRRRAAPPEPEGEGVPPTDPEPPLALVTDDSVDFVDDEPTEDHSLRPRRAPGPPTEDTERVRIPDIRPRGDETERMAVPAAKEQTTDRVAFVIDLEEDDEHRPTIPVRTRPDLDEG